MSTKELLKAKWETLKREQEEKLTLVDEVVRELNRGISNEVINNINIYVN